MSIREVSKKARMSFRDIGAILKKASGEKEESQDKKQSLLSPSSRAYSLFSEGKAPIEVAIALDLGESETTKCYEEYLNLKQMHELRMVYEEIGPDVMHFLELYKLSKDAHMKPEDVVNLLQVSNRYLPLVQQKYRKLMKETDSLESEKQKLKILWSQIRLSINTLDNYKKEIKNLQRQKINLGILINSGRYKKVRQIAEKEVNNSLSKQRDLLKLAVVSILESIRQNPDRYKFLINSNQYYLGPHAASYPYIDAYRTMILDESHKLFELMARNLTNEIINEPTLTIPS